MTDQPRESLATVLRRLEEIVRALEAEESDLDRSLALFEEGVSALRDARSRLEEAELRVRKVLEERGGELRAVEFDE